MWFGSSQPNTSWQRPGHAQLRPNLVPMRQRDVFASTDPRQRGRPQHDSPLGRLNAKHAKDRVFATVVFVVPRQDARLQPFAVVQLGYHRDDRRRDDEVPRGAREAGLRLHLHHLRWAPNRRAGRRRVRHRLEAGGYAGPGQAAAKVPAARVTLSDAADPRGRPPARRRADGELGPHRDHQGHGQGNDPVPALGPDRGFGEGARGVARSVGKAQRHIGHLAGQPSSVPSWVRPSGAQRDLGCRTGRQRRVRQHRRPQRSLDPIGPGPEHLRHLPPAKAADDAGAPVPHSSVQDQLGALRLSDRGQSLSDREDEEARAVHQRQRRGG